MDLIEQEPEAEASIGRTIVLMLDFAPPARIAMLVALVLSACSHQVRIGEATASGDGTRLELGLMECQGDYEVTVIEEDDTITFTAVDQHTPLTLSGADCMDGWIVDLTEPLGHRKLIDGSNGAIVDVRYEPWNQQRFSEAEFESAVEVAVSCILAEDPTVDVAVGTGPDGPHLDLDLGDLPDGASFDGRFIGACIDEHIEPLRR